MVLPHLSGIPFKSDTAYRMHQLGVFDANTAPAFVIITYMLRTCLRRFTNPTVVIFWSVSAVPTSISVGLITQNESML